MRIGECRERVNGLDRIVWDSPRARLGIATTGKSYGDVMAALSSLGIDEKVAADIGLRVYKVAMSWPLEPTGARRFAEGLEEILVVEEKRQVIELVVAEAKGRSLVLAGAGGYDTKEVIHMAGVAFAFGLSLLIAEYTIGAISGCHINPAVTLAMWITKKIPTRSIPAYIIGQIIAIGQR